MAHEHKQCPRARWRATRRQIVHGVGALLGGALTGCGGSPEPAAGASGSGGAGGSGTGGAGLGGSNGSGGAGAAAQGGSAGSGSARKSAADRVILGATGIEISRLAMGSGTHGSNGASDQTRLGPNGLANLLVYAYDQGITLFETADSYGAHPEVAEAIRQVGRQNVTVLTKTTAETAQALDADLDRFRRELGVDVIDIVLLHNKTSATWTTECAGAMEALERAKERGDIRAHGVSCHSLQALELAAETAWVDVDLARINPAGLVMDADPQTVIQVLTRMKAAGKGVLGMKILGEGRLASQLDMAIRHAVQLDCIDGFTIGFTSSSQLDQVRQRIEAA